MPARMTVFRAPAGTSIVASATGISTRAHTVKSNPTSPSGRCRAPVTYSGSTTEPVSIAVWKQVKLAAASSIARGGRPPCRRAGSPRRVRGVGPSSQSVPATDTNASAVVRSNQRYPPEASTAAPIIGPTAHASDQVERSTGVRRRDAAPATRSSRVRARAKTCGKAAVPAPSSATATSSRTGYEVVVVSARYPQAGASTARTAGHLLARRS
jgi:hypothetical protein